MCIYAWSRGSSGPNRASGTRLTGGSSGTGRAHSTRRAGGANRTGRAHHTRRAGRTCGPHGSPRARRAGQAGKTGGSHGAGKTSGSPRTRRSRDAADAALAGTAMTAAGFRFIAIVSHTESSFLYFSCAVQSPRPLQYMPPPAGRCPAVSTLNRFLQDGKGRCCYFPPDVIQWWYTNTRRAFS